MNIKTILLSAFILASALGARAQGHDFEVDGIYYNVLSFADMTAEVCGSDGNATDLVIPGEVSYNRRTFRVLSIGEEAFYGSALTSVVIGEGVQEIKYGAFLWSESLTEATIPASVTTIADVAFARTCLEKLIISDGPNDLTLDGEFVRSDISDYGDNRHLTSVYLGRNLTYTDEAHPPFEDEVAVTNFTIGRYVTDISSIGFATFTNLQTITLYAPTPPTTAGDFTNSQYMDVSVNIPRGTIDAYLADPVWGMFWNINEIDFDNAATVTISESGYSSFACKSGLDFSGYYDLSAFTGHLNGDRLTLTPILQVPAETGIILRGTPGKTYVIPFAEVTMPARSDLKAVTDDVDVDPLKANYVLAHVGDVPGFYRYTGTSIAAGHAYLELDAPLTGARGIRLDFGEATGIVGVSAAETSSDDGIYYTLDGRRVLNPVKGVYIKDGRKVIIK